MNGSENDFMDNSSCGGHFAKCNAQCQCYYAFYNVPLIPSLASQNPLRFGSSSCEPHEQNIKEILIL